MFQSLTKVVLSCATLFLQGCVTNYGCDKVNNSIHKKSSPLSLHDAQKILHKVIACYSCGVRVEFASTGGSNKNLWRCVNTVYTLGNLESHKKHKYASSELIDYIHEMVNHLRLIQNQYPILNEAPILNGGPDFQSILIKTSDNKYYMLSIGRTFSPMDIVLSQVDVINDKEIKFNYIEESCFLEFDRINEFSELINSKKFSSFRSSRAENEFSKKTYQEDN